MAVSIIDNNVLKLIDKYGVVLRYRMGTLCSCVGENNGVHKLGCGCNLGYRYSEPETISGIRTNVKHRYSNTPQGIIFNGDAQFTIPKRISTGEEQKAYKTLAHGDIISVVGKYKRDTDILRRDIKDKLSAFDVTEILKVSKKDKVYIPDVDYIVVGYNLPYLVNDLNNRLILTEKNEPILLSEVLKTIDRETKILWLQDGEHPEPDEYFTVEFTCEQQYKVWEDGTKDRGTSADEMPRKIIAVIRRYVNPDSNPMDNVNFTENIYQ